MCADVLVCLCVNEQTQRFLETISSLEKDVGMLDDTGPDVAAHARGASGSEAVCQRLGALRHLCQKGCAVRHPCHQNTTRKNTERETKAHNTPGVHAQSAGEKHVLTHTLLQNRGGGAGEKRRRKTHHIPVKSCFARAWGAVQMSCSIAASTSVMSTTR